MQKLTLFFIAMCLIFPNTVFGQDTYYWYRGKQIPLQINYEQVYIVATDALDLSRLSSELRTEIQSIKNENNAPKHSQRLRISRGENKLDRESYYRFVSELKKQPSIKNVEYVIGEGENSIALSSHFYVKLKNKNDYHLLNSIANEHNCEILREVAHTPLWYVLTPNKNAVKNTLEMANYLYETGLFADIDPGFMFDFKPSSTSFTPCSAEPMFSEQWNLEHINICGAWELSQKGNSSVKVAVFDNGINPYHPEFLGVPTVSYNAVENYFTNSGIETDMWHGLQVAGIIFAQHNDTMIAGIAPNVSLVNIIYFHPFNPSKPKYTSEVFTVGMNFAWRSVSDGGSGSDIINNSWGDYAGDIYKYLQSIMLEESIEKALDSGRDGLGCVVVFSAGNLGVIDYPAYVDERLLVVGSTDINKMRVSSSGYGPALDIVAPGGGVLTTSPQFIDTTHTDTELVIDVASGTSIAAPHVAGVAALMLSVNSNLTRQEVHDIILATAQKIDKDIYGDPIVYKDTLGRISWNIELGHGLLDACAAVAAALNTTCPNNVMYYSADICILNDNTYSNLVLGIGLGSFSGAKWYLGSISDTTIKAQNTGTFNLTDYIAEYLNENPNAKSVYVFLVLPNGDKYQWTVSINRPNNPAIITLSVDSKKPFDTLDSINIDCDGNPIAPVGTITYKDKNGKEKCLDLRDSNKIYLPLSMKLDSNIVWIVNGDTVATTTDKDTAGYFFPILPDWFDENSDEEYLEITLKLNDTTSITFRFRIKDNSIIATNFLPYISELWKDLFEYDLTEDSNTVSIEADLSDTNGFTLPLPKLENCKFSLKADSTVSWSYDTVSNSIVFAPTEECEINCRLKFICECLGILNIKIKNTNPACDEEPEIIPCDSILSEIYIYTGDIDKDGNFVNVESVSIDAPLAREQAKDFFKKCSFEMRFLLGNDGVVSISPSSAILDTIGDEIVLKVEFQASCFDGKAKTIEETYEITISNGDGLPCATFHQVFKCTCKIPEVYIHICNKSICYCQEIIMPPFGISPPPIDSIIVPPTTDSWEFWIYSSVTGMRLRLLYVLPAGSIPCGDFALDMSSFMAGHYFVTLEVNGMILDSTYFIYDGQNIIGVGSGNNNNSGGGSSNNSNSSNSNSSTDEEDS